MLARGTYMSAKLSLPISSRRVCGVPSELSRDVHFVVPQCYMNLSGRPVANAIRDLGVNSSLVVVADEYQLSMGTMRLRPRASAGSHNGIKSIVAALGREDFATLRVGVAPAGGLPDQVRRIDWLVKPLPAISATRSALATVFDAVARAIASAPTLDHAMTVVNAPVPS